MIKINYVEIVKKLLEDESYKVQVWDDKIELDKVEDESITLAFIHVTKQPDGDYRWDLSGENIMTCDTDSWHIFNNDEVLIYFYFRSPKNMSSDKFQNLYKIFIKKGLRHKDLDFLYKSLKAVKKPGFENWYRLVTKIAYNPDDPKRKLKTIHPKKFNEILKKDQAIRAKKEKEEKEKSEEVKKDG